MREFLPLFPKPGHYAGNEAGAIRKNPANVSLRIALAFPDTYEVGMSYLGQKILYEIVNSRPNWQAERVMAPEREACAILRANNAPLCTLEEDTPLNKVAAICFSVTHELCYTDILNMLDLAHIPLRQNQRGDDLQQWPIIMAGGGAMLGAEPISPFLDLVALGDGEELLPEILELLEKARKSGWTKNKFLEKARHISGVYVPAFFKEDAAGNLQPIYKDEKPRRRIVTDLDQAPYPERQIAPVGAVHNRLSLEIARGCGRGCRFCHAGMVYRPVRERSPQKVAELLDKCLDATGHEEVSFLALSAGDCTALKTIYSAAYARCQKEQIALALPSLRVGSVDDDIMGKIATLRRTGATLAPEAGSQRLRDVINKGVSENDLLTHLRKLLEHGWRQVKLYFMIGLPTETDADLLAIIDLCKKARDCGGQGAPRMQITVALSPFVPKPFTPFQWEAQPGLEEIRRRLQLLRDAAKGQKNIRLKWHEPEVSHLEGILSRGDRRLADVIEKAFHKGAIFCSWTETFSLAPWLEALAECGINAEDYIDARDLNSHLPWEHIEAGVARDFLLRERAKAYAEKITPDCRYGLCEMCGACDRGRNVSLLARSGKSGHKLVFTQRDQDSHEPHVDENGRLLLRIAKSEKPTLAPELAGRAGWRRIWHLKTGGAAWLSHLELQDVLLRALRRARLPVAFSQGFHPLPLISFGRALPVGAESLAEWFGLGLHTHVSPTKLKSALSVYLPKDLAIIDVELAEKRMEQAVCETFALCLEKDEELLIAAKMFGDFCAQDSHILTRETKKGLKTQDIRPLILNWKININANGQNQLIFNADWTESYLSPILLAKTILKSSDKSPQNWRLLKLRQVFASGREKTGQY